MCFCSFRLWFCLHVRVKVDVGVCEGGRCLCGCGAALRCESGGQVFGWTKGHVCGGNTASRWLQPPQCVQAAGWTCQSLHTFGVKCHTTGNETEDYFWLVTDMHISSTTSSFGHNCQLFTSVRWCEWVMTRFSFSSGFFCAYVSARGKFFLKQLFRGEVSRAEETNIKIPCGFRIKQAITIIMQQY